MKANIHMFYWTECIKIVAKGCRLPHQPRFGSSGLMFSAAAQVRRTKLATSWRYSSQALVETRKELVILALHVSVGGTPNEC